MRANLEAAKTNSQALGDLTMSEEHFDFEAYYAKQPFVLSVSLQDELESKSSGLLSKCQSEGKAQLTRLPSGSVIVEPLDDSADLGLAYSNISTGGIEAYANAARGSRLLWNGGAPFRLEQDYNRWFVERRDEHGRLLVDGYSIGIFDPSVPRLIDEEVVVDTRGLFGVVSRSDWQFLRPAHVFASVHYRRGKRSVKHLESIVDIVAPWLDTICRSDEHSSCPRQHVAAVEKGLISLQLSGAGDAVHFVACVVCAIGDGSYGNLPEEIEIQAV